MSTTPAQRKATDKYIAEKTDELKVRVPKGKKEAIQVYAKSTGESTNAFINRAIDETIEKNSKPEVKKQKPSA